MNILLKSESALYYECGFSCDSAYLLKLGREKFFVTDGRYTLEAKESVRGAEVVESSSLLAAVTSLLKASRTTMVHFDPLELSVKELDELTAKLHRVNFIVSENYSQRARIKKSLDEVELIRKSISLNALAFEKFEEFIRVQGIGLDERRLHFEAKRILSSEGDYDLSFDPIVAIEKNGAKPHALPCGDVLKNGDMLLFDAGIKYNRYCSDRTRTFEVGGESKVSKDQVLSNKKRQKVYDTVLKAQESAINSIKPGMKASEIDRVARSVICEAGYGDFFNHSTGHGIGLDIHELPRISQRSKDVIEEGMVFTVEPGIYLPGDFGVRIEDVVVVRGNGAEIL